MVYVHTPSKLDQYIKNRLERWKQAEDTIPLKQRRVLLVADTGWPGLWYFRLCSYDIPGYAPNQVEQYDSYNFV